MVDQSSLDDIPCELLLNGVFVRFVRIRRAAEPGVDFDVVVTDPGVGCFALHRGFEIDLHEPDATWRRVSLQELKGILKSRYLPSSDDLPKASEGAECRLFARVDDIQIPCGRHSVFGHREEPETQAPSIPPGRRWRWTCREASQLGKLSWRSSTAGN